MLELFLCSLFTIVPDFLYRRFVQGKRIGKEITFFSVWYELRWGITGCVMLTVLLITTIFYYHPSTTSVSTLFRTVPVLPETNGRVSEIYVGISDAVEKGERIFKLDSSRQEAAVAVARQRVSETEAALLVSHAEIAQAEAQIQQALSAQEQASDELETKQELVRRDPGNVARREIERLEVTLAGRKAQVAAAQATKAAAETRTNVLLPAQKATAQASLEEAETDLKRTVIYAGVSGRLEQFTLRVGDIVNPLMRPAGVLIPSEAGRRQVQAGFGQIEAQVIKPGMAAEITCVSKPMTIIPMVVASFQDFIAAGQVRAGEQLLDVQNIRVPGTITVFLQPLYPGGLDGVTPGSSCIANLYTNNHDRIAKAGFFEGFLLHGIDAVALVHAMILRVQALVLPIKVLVFSGGH